MDHVKKRVREKMVQVLQQVWCQYRHREVTDPVNTSFKYQRIRCVFSCCLTTGTSSIMRYAVQCVCYFVWGWLRDVTIIVQALLTWEWNWTLTVLRFTQHYDENSVFLGYDAVLLGNLFVMFWRNIVLLSQVYGPVTINTTPSLIVVSEKNGVLILWQLNVLGFRSLYDWGWTQESLYTAQGYILRLFYVQRNVFKMGPRSFLFCVCLFTQGYDTTNASAHISYL